MTRGAAVVLAAALVLGGAVRAYQLPAPFGYGFDGWLGGMYGQAARNFARHGVLEMRLAPVMEGGPLRWGDVVPHSHHPPLVPVIFGVSARALGVSEWALRLPSALATLASIVLIFLIGRKLSPGGAGEGGRGGPAERGSGREGGDERTERAGAWAALAFAALPMTAVFGGLVNFEPIVLALVLGTWLAYLRYRETARPRDLALLIALFVGAILADWYGGFVGPAIAAHAWLQRPRARWWLVPLLGGIAVAVAAGVFAYYEWIWPGAAAELVRRAQHRASAVKHDYTQETYSLALWLKTQAYYFTRYYTIAGLALGAIGIVAMWRRGGAAAAALSLVGLQCVALLPQASFQHSFISYPFGAAVALGIGLSVEWVADGAGRRGVSWGRAARVAAAVPLVLFAWSAWTVASRELREMRHDRAYRDLGLAIADAVPFEAGVATPGVEYSVWVPAGFYADRAIALGIDSLEKLEAERRAPRRPRAPVRYVVFTPPLFRQHEAFARALVERFPHAKDDRLLVVDVGPVR